MSARPPSLVQIHTGAAIGAVRFFSQAWNWLIAWVWNVAAGNGIEIVGRESDHPEIRANLGAGTGLKLSLIHI